MTKVAIDSIIVSGERFRTDLGNIAELAESIKEHGLLQPIVISKDMTLLCGERRLTACKSLGMTEIEANVMDPEDDRQSMMMEVAENEVRKPFSVSERLAWAAALYPQVSERVRADKKAARAEGKKAGTVRTDDVVAKESGFGSRENMRRAQYIAENDSDMLKRVDDGEVSIKAAYEELKERARQQEEEIAIQKAELEERDATIKSYEKSEDEMSDAYERLAVRCSDMEKKLKVAEANADYKDRDTVAQNIIDALTSERDEALRQRDEASDKLQQRYRPTAIQDAALVQYLAIGDSISKANFDQRVKIGEILAKIADEIAAVVA